MSAPPRYAIYFVPPAESAIYRFGAGLLGYDAFEAAELEHPPHVLDAVSGWHGLTSDARKYGFHATLKAPFSLRTGSSEGDLAISFDRFAQTPRVIAAITPVIRRIGGFIAIVPEATSAPLAQLADDCVTAFEPHRAPLSDADRQRRLKTSLTSRQIAHLDRWGYPYVFEEFRFHMTLTARLTAPTDATVLQFLQSEFAKLGFPSLTIGHIALLRQQSAEQRFAIIRHAALKAI